MTSSAIRNARRFPENHARSDFSGFVGIVASVSISLAAALSEGYTHEKKSWEMIFASTSGDAETAAGEFPHNGSMSRLAVDDTFVLEQIAVNKKNNESFFSPERGALSRAGDTHKKSVVHITLFTVSSSRSMYASQKLLKMETLGVHAAPPYLRVAAT
jgi:hypothetical protein